MKTILFCFLLVVVPVGGSEYWEVKNYAQWSQQECQQLLVDSPWAKSYRGNALYIARFLSALPIRQAIVRQRQIAHNYEQLSPQRRKEFDQQSEEYLSRQFTDTIVINVKFGGRPEVVDYWWSRTTELLKNDVYLIVNNRKIPLLQFSQSRDSILPGQTNEFQFIFPRLDKDLAIRSAKDEVISLILPVPRIFPNQVSNKSSEESLFEPKTALIEFKMNKMLIKGNVLY
jgi:hypothetical protein